MICSSRRAIARRLVVVRREMLSTPSFRHGLLRGAASPSVAITATWLHDGRRHHHKSIDSSPRSFRSIHATSIAVPSSVSTSTETTFGQSPTDFCLSSFPQQTAITRRSMSSAAADAPQTRHSKTKPWLDRQRSLSSRVEALVDSPWIHPAEFRVGSDLHELLLECCHLQTLQGQQMAQEVMERLLLEKTRINQQQIEEVQAKGGATTDVGDAVYIPERFWQNVIFGWSKNAGKVRDARIRMRETLLSAIEAAKEDYHHDQERNNLTANYSGGDDTSQQYLRSSEPTLELFNTYLLGLSRASKTTAKASMQAESTLFDMMEYHEQYGWHVKPNTKSYTHTINALSNSRHKESGERALNILNHVKRTHEAEKQAYPARCGISYEERGPDHPRIVTPDGIMYTNVMMAMLKSRSMSAQRIVDLLHEFLDLAKKSDESSDDSIQVDASHFTVPIRALGNDIDRIKNGAVRVKLAKQAESILHLMFEYIAKKENEDSQDSSGQFEKALYAFNACLDAWSRAHVQEAALRCEDLLKQMLEKSATKNDGSSSSTGTSNDVVLEPDTVSFNSCLQAWSKAHPFYSDAAYRANELLELYCQMHESGLIQKGPDLQSWTIAILALQHVKPSSATSSGGSSSIDEDGASVVRRARSLLDKMLRAVENRSTTLSARHLSGPFTAVIRVAAKMADADSGSHTAALPEDSTTNKDEDMIDDDSSSSDLLFGDTGTGDMMVEGSAGGDAHDDFQQEQHGMDDPYSIACDTYRDAVDDVYDLRVRQQEYKNRDQLDQNDDDDGTPSNAATTSSSAGASTTISDGGIADHHTFAAMLSCIDRYNPHPASSERKTQAEMVFADACQAGQVSRVVLHEAVSVLQIPAAMEAKEKDTIPRFWYRNVQRGWRPVK